MRRIDELHLDYPFAGSRMLQTFLAREGYEVGRLHVATLMKRMGIEAIYRQPNPEARASIGRYIDGFYNARRPHSSLDRRTPDEAYFTALQPIAVAA